MEASAEQIHGGNTATCNNCGHEQLLFGSRCVKCGKPLTLTEPSPGGIEPIANGPSREEPFFGEYAANGCCSPLAAAMELAAEEPEPASCRPRR